VGLFAFPLNGFMAALKVRFMSNNQGPIQFIFFPRVLSGYFARVFWILLFVALTATLPAQDAKYLEAYGKIDQADGLQEKGNMEGAKEKYLEAQTTLLAIQKNFPKWNSAAVGFRLKYVSGKLAALSPAPAAAPAVSAVAAPAPVADAKTKTSAPAKAPAKSASATDVKLLEPGAEPRKALRIQPKAGDKQTMVMTIQMGMDMGVGQPMKMPAVKTTMEMTVKSVSAEGDISYEMLTTDASIAEDPAAAPQIVAAMKTSVERFRGLAVSGVMTSRGVVESLEAKVPQGADAQAKQYIEQMKQSFASSSMAFPEAEVGAGAKWQVQTPLKSQGMTMDQVTTYELVSNNDNRLELKSTVTQNAGKQKIRNPAAPKVQVDLTKLSGTGGGTVTFDLNKVLPSLASLESHTEMSMGVNAGGKNQNLNMKMDMTFRMESQ
jgi:hypothetical protein